MGKWKPGQPPPKTVNHDLLVQILGAHGWKLERGGKHATKMTMPGQRPVTIPRHRGADFDKRLRAAILKQAGLDSNDTLE